MYRGLDAEDVKRLIESGESSKVEFKGDSVHNDRLAMEIAAFANFKGGVILLGVSPEKIMKSADEYLLFPFEVRSPGLIPNFLTVEKMKMGVNYYRNPVLMSYFYDRGANRATRAWHPDGVC